MSKQLWWEAPKGQPEVHQTVTSIIRHMDSTQSGLQAANMRHLRLYSNQEAQAALSIAGYVAQSQTTAPVGRTSRISLNVVKSCIDTLVSKIGKNKVKPYFLTKKGSVRQQEKAQTLNKFTTGLFYQTGVYKKAPKVLRDALIMGTGVCKVYTDQATNKIVVERVFPDELAVDVNDGYYGEPRSLYQRKFIGKAHLKAMTKDANVQRLIEQCPTQSLSPGVASDLVLVMEAWHLPSGTNVKDGRHVICIENATLLDEKWEDDTFPFAILHYDEPVLGFFGTGVAETLTGIQIEINRLLVHVQDSMKLLGNPRVFLERTSKVNASHLNNQIGGIVQYDGKAPVIQAAQAVHPETFRQIEGLYSKAFEVVGVSQLSAQSQKPGGLDSGKALREFSDIETERFATLALAYQEFHLDVAKLAFREIRRQHKAGKPSYTVQSFDRKSGLEKISWSEINLDDDAFIMQPFPTSALSDTPSARLQDVQELAQAMPDKFDSDIVMDLLDFPDLDSYQSLMESPTRLARKVCERIMRDLEYRPPEPSWNLAKCMQFANLYCMSIEMQDKIDEEDGIALGLLQQFRDECMALIQQSQQPAPQPEVDPAMVDPAAIPVA